MRLLSLFLALGLSGSAAAQDVEPTDVQRVAGYDKNGFNGFFIQNPSGDFRLEIGAYSQFRYNFTFRQDAEGEDIPVEHGFSVPRTRFLFTGQWTDRLPYHVRLNVNGTGTIELLVAFQQFNFGKDNSHYIRAGRQFVPMSREDWMYGQDYLGIEFSENDFTYALGPSSGLLYFHGLDKVRYWFSVTNGAVGGKEDFPSREVSDFMATFRFEGLVAGDDWGGFDDLIGRRGRPFAIMWGVAAGYQGKYRDGVDPRDAGQAITDLSFSGNGYHVLLSGIYTWRIPQGEDTIHDLGVLAQGSYFIHPMVAPYVRYNFLHRFEDDSIDPWHSLAAGFSVLPFTWTNRMKINIEASYALQGINTTVVAPDGMLGWLASDEPQWALRMQTQFGF